MMKKNLQKLKQDLKLKTPEDSNLFHSSKISILTPSSEKIEKELSDEKSSSTLTGHKRDKPDGLPQQVEKRHKNGVKNGLDW